MFNRHIPALYAQKPTLAELYTDDSTIFAGLSLPSGVDVSAVVQFLLLKFGSLETIFQTAADAKAGFATWSTCHGEQWGKMWDALRTAYAPLENYDMVEQMTNDTTTRQGTSGSTRTDNLTHAKTGTETVTPNLTDTETPNETRNNSSGVYGFNSAQAVPDATDAETRTGTNTRTTTGNSSTQYNTSDTDTGTQSTSDTHSDTETRNYTLTRSGNIGVTTSQQMLEAEMRLRLNWNFYEVVACMFEREFCVIVW